MYFTKELVAVLLVLIAMSSVNAAPHLRTKRHAPTEVRAHLSDGTNVLAQDLIDGAGIVDDMTDEEIQNLVPEHTPLSRSRRSAVFLLSATMRLCGERYGLCRRVEVREGGAKAILRLSDY